MRGFGLALYGGKVWWLGRTAPTCVTHIIVFTTCFCARPSTFGMCTLAGLQTPHCRVAGWTIQSGIVSVARACTAAIVSTGRNSDTYGDCEEAYTQPPTKLRAATSVPKHGQRRHIERRLVVRCVPRLCEWTLALESCQVSHKLRPSFPAGTWLM